MNPSNQLINRLASLKAGRNIVWTNQTAVQGSNLTAAEIQALTGNGVPNSGEGTALDPGDGSTPLRLFWRAQLRRGTYSGGVYLPYFTFSILIGTVANNQLYRVTVDDGGGAVNCDYTSDGTATMQEVCDGVQSAIETEISGNGWGLTVDDSLSPLGLTITSDPTVDGWDQQNFSVSVNSTTYLVLNTDASYATLQLWTKMSGLPTAQAQFDLYRFPDGNDYITIVRNGSGMIDIPGVSHAKLVVTDTDGYVQPSIGVAKIEV